jgi:hypothetical protein
LLVINELNTRTFTDPTSGRLIGVPTGDTRYPDVNDDGFVTPVDALLIINDLNQQAAATDAFMARAGDGEAEPPGQSNPFVTDLATEMAMALDSALMERSWRQRGIIDKPRWLSS